MKKVFQFGEEVPGYNIKVLNEREIRAGAGILFVLLLISFFLILGKGNFIMIKYMITTFLIDFLIRVLINPRFSPSLIIGRLIVRNQVPEYVGAIQKKFAWIIGIILALTMFILMVVLNTVSIINGLSCLVCLIFLFFESAFGICLGCKVYSWIYREKAQYCPGEVCEVKDRQEIQKTSGRQWLVLLLFAGVIYLVVLIYHPHIIEKPHPLFGNPAEQPK